MHEASGLFPVTPRTDVTNWLLIAWMKGDYHQDNPKREDDHVNSITLTAGGECPLCAIMTFSYRVLKDKQLISWLAQVSPCQCQQHHAGSVLSADAVDEASRGFHISVGYLLFTMLVLYLMFHVLMLFAMLCHTKNTSHTSFL